MTRTRGRESAPSTLPSYARALLPAVPVLGSLPGLRKDAADRLPDLECHRVAVRTDTDHLATYARLTGHGLADRLPGLYPHLAAFGPQLALLTDRRFPFPALGLVQVAHSVVVHRPLRTSETYDLAVRAARLRPHRSGRLVDLDTTVTVDGERVWEETTTVLARGGGDRDAPGGAPLAGVAPPVGHIRWRVPGRVGRAYAVLSGDVNPIHLGSLPARAFGFPRAIAHGMWTAARALAAVESMLPESYRYQVAFRRPVLLPAQLRFGSASGPDGSRLLGVLSADGDTEHLVGRVMPTG